MAVPTCGIADFCVAASLNDLHYDDRRNLECRCITELDQCDWTRRSQNLLITGPCCAGHNLRLVLARLRLFCLDIPSRFQAWIANFGALDRRIGRFGSGEWLSSNKTVALNPFQALRIA